MTASAAGIVTTLHSCDRGEPTIIVEVAGRSRRFLPAAFRVDTGSSHSLIGVQLGRAIGLAHVPTKNLGTPAGFAIPYTPTLLHIGVKADDGRQIFVTVSGGVADVTHNVLGRDFLQNFRFAWYGSTVSLSLSGEGEER